MDEKGHKMLLYIACSNMIESNPLIVYHEQNSTSFYSAKEAGITIFQEIGLDPGIDHLLAMECIEEVREQGGKVKS